MALTKPKASQIDFDVTNITDPLIRLNSGESGSADKDAGFVIERGDDQNRGIIWDESSDQWAFINTTETGTTAGNVTIAAYASLQVNELVAASLDVSGNADIDGTMEADAITVDGTALNEYIADTIGAMVGSNTETGITVTYEDGDNTLDFVVGTLNQDTTGTADNFTVTANDTTDETVYPVFVDGATGSQGAESDTGLTYNPSSGLLTTAAVTASGTGVIVVPVGTTAQRVATQGGIRFNTTTSRFEGYNGSAWVNIDTLYSQTFL